MSRYSLSEISDILHLCDNEARTIADRIAGPHGQPNQCPDGVRVLEDAETVLTAAFRHLDQQAGPQGDHTNAICKELQSAIDALRPAHISAVLNGEILDDHEQQCAAVHNHIMDAVITLMWALDLAAAQPATYQDRIMSWGLMCFGDSFVERKRQRGHRFFEEAAGLVQALNVTREECYELIDYVYGRPMGEPTQEVGGVMVTLASLCAVNEIDMMASAEAEYARVNTPELIDRIRAKQATKPKFSALPGNAPEAGQ